MKKSPRREARGRGERGAALVTALLMTTLLLSAGGALIITTGMSATTAADSTAEMQAYYAAEAGLEAALAVLRRNVPSTPAGTTATFRNVVCGTANPCNNTGGDFSTWLTAASRVLSNNPPASYSLTVRDASLAPGAALPAAPYVPRFLVVTSTGIGPKGARKVLEMTVDRFKFTYDAPAPIVLRESEDNATHVSLIPGAGTPNEYSGADVSNAAAPAKPAVGVGDTTFLATTDYSLATTTMAGEVLTGGVGKVGTPTQPWPDIVSNATSTAATVSQMKQLATSTACPGNTTPLKGFTFVEGYCKLNPGNSGSGFLVVTGDLELSGAVNFSGLIFVLGTGKVVRSGGGGGLIEGGILAAKYTGNGSGGFGGVVFDVSGGGNSKIKYNSRAIEEALAEFGPRPVGVVEK